MAQRSVKVGNISGNRGRINITTGNIVENIQHIYERSLTAAEEEEKARSIEYKRLAQGIALSLERMKTAAEEPVTRNPYRGLLYYQLADNGIFFGRDKDIESLLSVIDQGSFAILYSESGAGKTSLLQAGIVPYLIACEVLPVYIRSHDKNPALAIKRNFIPDLSQVPTLEKAPLAEFLQQVSEIVGPQTGLYLLLDQFEEFFIKASEADQKAFIEEMGDCLDNNSLNVHWLVSMRKEYFGYFHAFAKRVRNPYENYYFLNKLTRQQAQEVISKSAKKYRLIYQKELIESILDDLGREVIDPPQLQLVCKALYEANPDPRTPLSLELYQKEGGATGILTDHLKRVVSRDIPPEKRFIARGLLEALVTSVPQRTIRSHQELAEQLVSKNVSLEDVDAVLGQLIDSHLVRAEETEDGLRYELVHDYLLEEIRLDPQTRQKKLAEDLLRQGTENWQRHGVLLGRDAIEIIDRERSRLKPTSDETELFILSAIEQKQNPKAWKGFLDQEARQRIIVENTKRLNNKDKRVQQRANALLWFFATDQPRSMRNKYLLKEIPRRSAVQVLPRTTKYFSIAVAVVIVFSVLTIASSVAAGESGWRLVSTFSDQCLSGKKPGLLDVSIDRNQDSNFAVFDRTNNTLCESMDAGYSWERVSLPSAENVVSMATGNDKIFILFPYEIYYWKFGGSRWIGLVPPQSSKGEFVGIALNPKTPDEIMIATSANELVSLQNIENKLTSTNLDTTQIIQGPPASEQIIGVSTDGSKIVLATTNKIWYSEYPDIDWHEVKETETPQKVHSIVIFDDYFYGITGDARITTGEFGREIMIGPQESGEEPLPSWPDTKVAVQSMATSGSVTLVGNTSGLKCHLGWNWLSPEWWRLFFFTSKPCPIEKGG